MYIYIYINVNQQSPCLISVLSARMIFVNASFQFSVQMRDARIPASLAGGSCRWRNKAGMRPGR